MARSTTRHGSWRRLTTLGATAAVGLVLLGTATAGSAGALTSAPPSRPATTGDVGATPTPAKSSQPHPRTALERATDLTVTIDSVSPSTLTRGTDLHVSGTVDNSGSERF